MGSDDPVQAVGLQEIHGHVWAVEHGMFPTVPVLAAVPGDGVAEEHVMHHSFMLVLRLRGDLAVAGNLIDHLKSDVVLGEQTGMHHEDGLLYYRCKGEDSPEFLEEIEAAWDLVSDLPLKPVVHVRSTVLHAAPVEVNCIRACNEPSHQKKNGFYVHLTVPHHIPIENVKHVCVGVAWGTKPLENGEDVVELSLDVSDNNHAARVHRYCNI
mmetsp:Transcript_50570/g.90317  ORF Transcript_50570/g.90317 Transcript_50570/m.90317 type:complete len:211 (+) Transcript_50570:2540-3172(+)